MAKLISKTYGDALFELALEEEKLDRFREEMEFIQKTLMEHDELDRLLKHPKITKEEKIGVLENIYKGRVQEEIMGFLQMILLKDRYSYAQEIISYFLDRVKEEKGIGVAYVTTAILLNEKQCSDIEKRLLETTEFREMEMHFSKDPALIGGMQIRIKDRVIDSSIQSKMNDLKRTLMNIQLT